MAELVVKEKPDVAVFQEFDGETPVLRRPILQPAVLAQCFDLVGELIPGEDGSIAGSYSGTALSMAYPGLRVGALVDDFSAIYDDEPNLLDEVVVTARENKADRIFVGNLGSALGELRLDFLDWLRAKYQDTRWHWLGFAPHDGILSSKPVSVDTASAIYNRKFKTLWLPYLPPKSLDSEQFRKLPRETALSLLRRVRFGPEAYRELCTPQGWRAGRYGAGASLALMVTLSTALWYSDWLKDKAGTIFYQAVNTKPDLESFLKAQQHLAVPGIQSSFRRARSK